MPYGSEARVHVQIKTPKRRYSRVKGWDGRKWQNMYRDKKIDFLVAVY